MKKAANSTLRDLCQSLKSLSSDEQDKLFRQLVYAICETGSLLFLSKRGNGQIPFQLKTLIRSWLNPRCRQLRMPELRWFYQIFKDDPDDDTCALACRYLDAAYVQAPDDAQTQTLVFERNVHALAFGLNELPVGLLLAEKETQNLFHQCDVILQHGKISKDLIDRYFEAKRIYSAYGANEPLRTVPFPVEGNSVPSAAAYTASDQLQ